MGLFVTGNKSITEIREFPGITVRERLKKVEITGYSRMTNTAEYYEDLLKILENHFHTFKKTLIIDFRFEYINTSSTKWLFQMLTSFQELVANKGLIEINWYYEEDDETIFETGEILSSVLKIPFHLKQIPIL
jgi:hypothetical protein